MFGLFGDEIKDGVQGAIEGVGGVLDDLFTSDEERMKASAAFKRIEQEMRKLEVELSKAYLKDAESARDMQMELMKHKGAVKYTPLALTVILGIGFFVMLGTILTSAIPEDSSDAAFLLLGVLGGAFGQAVNFWLGSSNGSKTKTEGLIEAAKGKAAPAAPAPPPPPNDKWG